MSTQAIASLGWLHKGSLWVYKIADTPRIVKLSDSKYLTIKAGNKDFFSVVHHSDADEVAISAHNHSDPHRVLSSITMRGARRTGIAKTETIISGDRAVWQELPHAYVAFAFGDFHLFLVNRNGEVSLRAFEWYNSSSYDKDYQGIVGVEELPNSSLLIVSVQRDSNPVLYDPDTGKQVRKLNLASGRSGNPHFRVRTSVNELWAGDYDRIVKLDAKTFNVIAAKQLQEGNTGLQQFIGEFSFCRGERLCLIARPFHGDVIGLDCETMLQTHRALLGKQPLVCGLLGDDTIIALDWKTGDFLHGKLEKT